MRQAAWAAQGAAIVTSKSAAVWRKWHMTGPQR